MKKLLCVVMFCFLFGLVYAENPLDSISSEEIKSHNAKSMEEAKATVTDEVISKFCMSTTGKKMKECKFRYNSWRNKFKSGIEKLANTDDKYVRLKEIVNELDSMCLTFKIKFDPNRIQMLSDEGIVIKDLSFFHFCKFFAYSRTHDLEYALNEFNKIDDKLKPIIPELYFYASITKCQIGDGEGGIKMLKEGMEKNPTLFIASTLELIYYYVLKETNTKEYLDLKNTLLVLIYYDKVLKNK